MFTPSHLFAVKAAPEMLFHCVYLVEAEAGNVCLHGRTLLLHCGEEQAQDPMAGSLLGSFLLPLISGRTLNRMRAKLSHFTKVRRGLKKIARQ